MLCPNKANAFSATKGCLNLGHVTKKCFVLRTLEHLAGYNAPSKHDILAIDLQTDPSMKTALFSFISSLLLLTQAFASSPAPETVSLFSHKVGSQSLYDRLKAQGVPEEAISRSFVFLDAYAGKSLVVDKKIRPKGEPAYMTRGPITIQSKYAAIIDYSRPSTSKRLYLIDLSTGQVEKFYVAHGRNSGTLVPTEFSNVNMSKMTSLGIMVGGDTYVGGHGRSMNLYGLEPTNSLTAERDIVMHGADYVSDRFIENNGRLGLSWGCPAVEPRVLPKLIEALGNGSMIYHYYPGLEKIAGENPLRQQFAPVPENSAFPMMDLPGEEEDFQAHRK